MLLEQVLLLQLLPHNQSRSYLFLLLNYLIHPIRLHMNFSQSNISFYFPHHNPIQSINRNETNFTITNYSLHKFYLKFNQNLFVLQIFLLIQSKTSFKYCLNLKLQKVLLIHRSKTLLYLLENQIIEDLVLLILSL